MLFGLTFIAAMAVATPSPDDLKNIALSTAIVTRVGDRVWPGWTKTAFPIDLVTANGPVEIGFDKPVPAPPFPPQMEATFPWTNGIPTIVIGQPQFAQAKTPVRWSVTLIHEHFHQWQYSWPGYLAAVRGLGLAPRGDTNSMWMLNYPFPYKDRNVDRAYALLASRLADAVEAIGGDEFARKVRAYVNARNAFESALKPPDYRYFAFQCWQEGVARYTEIVVPRLAAAEHARDLGFLSGEQSAALAADAETTYKNVIKRLRNAPLQDDERVNFYALGAGEALLLDRVSPGWHERYLDARMDLGKYFAAH